MSPGLIYSSISKVNPHLFLKHYTSVISAAHRWERITVQSEEFYLLDQWFDALPPTAPLLTSIEVELDEIGPYPNDTGRRIFPGGAASLTSVSVIGIGLHHCCPPLALLNHLHLHTVPKIMWTSYEEIGAMINVSSMLTLSTVTFLKVLSPPPGPRWSYHPFESLTLVTSLELQT